MSNNLSFEDIVPVNDFLILIENLEGNCFACQIQDSIYTYEIESNLKKVFGTVADTSIDFQAVPINNHCKIWTGKKDDTIIGVGNASSNATDNAEAELDTNAIENNTATVVSESDSSADTLAIGINNTGEIYTGRGNDRIIGIANATAQTQATSNSQVVAASLEPPVNDILSDSNAQGIVQADGVGISNAGKIQTGKGDDVIFGIANVDAQGKAITDSQVSLVRQTNSSVNAQSESLSIVDTLGIGIDNLGTISTGKGSDIIIGIANSSTMNESIARASIANLAEVNQEDIITVEEIETAILQTMANAISDSITNNLGIINSGEINTGKGHDLIAGLAINTTFSDAVANAAVDFTGDDITTVAADARALAIARGNTVGIVNQGKINSGRGNDIILGIAINNSTADANADAIAETIANDSDANANSSAIADTSESFSIGIDNTSGVIATGRGNDLVFGRGVIGITGGKIQTGKGHDRVLGYGEIAGVANSEIELGKGDDYFQAAIIDSDSDLSEFSLAENQFRAISETTVFGDRGNDTFEIDGFGDNVVLNGGHDHDVLKLAGQIDDYKIGINSSAYQSLTIQADDSILMVENVETFYFGNDDFAYHFSDFA